MVPRIEKLDIHRLSHAAGVDLEPHAEYLMDWVNRYLEFKTELSTAPKARDVVSRLEKIRRHSRILADLLADHSDPGQSALISCFEQRQDTPEELSRSLASLSASADLGLSEWQVATTVKRGAPSKNSFLYLMISALSAIYDEAGGRGVGCYWDPFISDYHGPLLEFICEFLAEAKKAGGPKFSRSTVAQAIKNEEKKQSLEYLLDRLHRYGSATVTVGPRSRIPSYLRRAIQGSRATKSTLA